MGALLVLARSLVGVPDPQNEEMGGITIKLIPAESLIASGRCTRVSCPPGDPMIEEKCGTFWSDEAGRNPERRCRRFSFDCGNDVSDWTHLAENLSEMI